MPAARLVFIELAIMIGREAVGNWEGAAVDQEARGVEEQQVLLFERGD